MKVWHFMAEFISALYERLKEDDIKWGNTWLERTRDGQESRIEEDIIGYFNEYHGSGTPIPWLKLVGVTMIGWIREQHPEIWPK